MTTEIQARMLCGVVKKLTLVTWKASWRREPIDMNLKE